MAYHEPVLLNESIDGLNIRPKGIYADLTFGGGGHSREVLKQLGKHGRLLAFDQDQDAEANIPGDKRVTFIRANFRYLKHFLRYYDIDFLDGILADLGISSHQINEPQRGFSFRSNQPLDMRMNQMAGATASDVLNSRTAAELTGIFRRYGELSNATRISEAIVTARKERPISTSADLSDALGRLVPAKHPNKFLARVYQALRLEVNEEIGALEEMLSQSVDVLREGGRLVIISYHSLEDRLVKNFIRSGNLEGKIMKDFFGNVITPWRAVNKRVIGPTDTEMKKNPRARSARLRVGERVVPVNKKKS